MRFKAIQQEEHPKGDAEFDIFWQKVGLVWHMLSPDESKTVEEVTTGVLCYMKWYAGDFDDEYEELAEFKVAWCLIKLVERGLAEVIWEGSR